MIFNSIIYIFLFLPMALLVYYVTPMKWRNIVLLLLSLLFFSWGSPTYVGLLLISMGVNYLGVLKMASLKDTRHKRYFLTMLLTLNVLILLVFKYLGFFIINLNLLFGTGIYAEKLTQPLGLSFYTFQVLSYILDVYKGTERAERNPLKAALYFIMFPQLFSGPIMRYSEIKPQLAPRLIKLRVIAEGMERFIIGLFKKVFIANTLGALWTIVKATDPAVMSVLTAWVGIIAFTFYIYFDFSGYMDMAIGTANMFGFQLQENFNFPYISKSISEFWRRWHMTLGRWFRDYIYIPMGGSREGNFKLIINTLTVWAVTGLWHGASWNFVVWGVYMGIIILAEKFLLKDFLRRIPKAIASVYTMILIMVGWVIFDTPSLTYAGKYIKVLFGSGKFIDNTGIYYLYTHLVIFLLGFFLSGPVIYERFAKLKRETNRSRNILFIAGLLLLFIVSVAYILNQSFSPSMYIGF